jgi:ABC-type transport system involved in Fe-S cluster assembly fused permease/ATPase subunit
MQVKYYGAEDFEVSRYTAAIRDYQVCVFSENSTKLLLIALSL